MRTAIGKLALAAIAGWISVALTEAVLLFGLLPLFAAVMEPGLLPSLKAVFDIGALAMGGWAAGRIGRPRIVAAAGLTAVGLLVVDLTPYLPLNTPWLLRLAMNAAGDSSYFPSFMSALLVHAILFGSLVVGACLSRPRRPLVGIGL